MMRANFSWQIIGIIVVALIFEFVNGFHDTANAVATSISTRSLEPLHAICLAAVFNLLGALSGTAVALTIAKGFASPELASSPVILAAILGALIWNLLTWYLGIPSSSSHSLIGGLLGAIIMSTNFHTINYHNVVTKLILPMITSPVLAFILAGAIAILLYSILARKSTELHKTNNFIREVQVLSTMFLSFSHGTNDAQKTMGIITLLLYGNTSQALIVPLWVIVLCATCMGCGTLAGGLKIIKTLSTRVTKLKPANGVAAELSSALLLFVGSRLGLPLSTTHATSGAIMGAGILGKFGVNWSVVKSIVTAWVLTLPVCALLSALIFKLVVPFF